jgi:Protein of unknown function (DUF3830)
MDRSRSKDPVVLEIVSGDVRFTARLEEESAPATVAAFRKLLPLDSRVIHVRWSGESMWIPFGELEVGIGPENATSYPAPGELLLYPGGVSETELLFPYGACCFASKAGQLAGNHFATVVQGGERLRELGVKCLWEGAQQITVRER